MVHPPKKFNVVRRAVSEAPPVNKAHPMQQAFIKAAKRVSAVLNGASLSASDMQLLMPIELRRDVHDLVYGTLRRYGEGDAALRLLVDREPDSMIRALLLVALYRLASRPESEHVVVDQAVDAAGVMTERKAGGFVNAILRNYLRRRTALAEEIARLPEVQHLHPVWWTRRLEAAWPERWQGVIAADNAPPPLTLRVNARRGTRLGLIARLAAANVSATAVDGFSAAIRLPEGARVDTLPGFVEGDFAVQDPGAQRAAEWLDVQDGQHVLDACAAPGGKSGHLLELADIKLVALDVDANRVAPGRT